MAVGRQRAYSPRGSVQKAIAARVRAILAELLAFDLKPTVRHVFYRLVEDRLIAQAPGHAQVRLVFGDVAPKTLFRAKGLAVGLFVVADEVGRGSGSPSCATFRCRTCTWARCAGT
jgi:hypothetical protein